MKRPSKPEVKASQGHTKVSVVKRSKGVPKALVTRVTVDGYTVYSSPVKPVFRTREQIAKAVAAAN